MELYEAALAACRGLTPPDRRGEVEALRGLAWLHFDKGEERKLIGLWEEALEAEKSLYPPYHAELAITAGRLAVHCLYGGFKPLYRGKVLRLMVRLFVSWRTVLPPTHPGIALVLSYIGEAYVGGNPKNAARVRKALLPILAQIPRDAFDSEDALVLARAFSDIAHSSQLRGGNRVEKARQEAMLRQALGIRRRLLPPSDRAMTASVSQMVSWYLRVDSEQRYDLRLTMLKEHIVELREVLPWEHPRFISLLVLMGALHWNKGEHHVGLGLLREAFRMVKGSMCAESPMANVVADSLRKAEVWMGNKGRAADVDKWMAREHLKAIEALVEELPEELDWLMSGLYELLAQACRSVREMEMAQRFAERAAKAGASGTTLSSDQWSDLMKVAEELLKSVEGVQIAV